MKKIISLILALTMIVSSSNIAIANEGENYKYILPMEYSRIEINANCIVACDNYGKCAVYDFDGKKISDDFDNIGNFVDNQVALASNGTTSYVINYQGTIISQFDKRVIGIDNFVFVNHSDINNDGRPLSYYEGEFGVYTYNGKLLKVLSYDKFMPTKASGYGITFSGYKLIYEENGKFGALDSDFNVAIQPEFDKIYPFYNTDSYITVAMKNGKYGLIDNYGGTVADFVYDYIDPLYENGKINSYKVKQGENYGLLDKFGNMIKTPDEKIPKALHENYSLIEVYVENTREDSAEYANLYGLIDFDGNIVIPIEHTNISGISEGIIEAQKSYDHRGYYDLSGNEITDFKYRIASRFSEGLAFTESYTDGVWTNEVINNKGEVVFMPDSWSNGFYGGIAYMRNGKFIDKSGNVVIHNEDWKTVSGLNWWDSTRDGMFIVSNGDLSGLVKYIPDDENLDTPSDWATKTVDEAITLKLVPDELQKRYRKNINREDFCEIAYNLPVIQNALKDKNIKLGSFDDTDNEKILLLNSLGIIKGVGDNKFAPESFITREEAATILKRICDIANFETHHLSSAFDDDVMISDWAKAAVYAMRALGIMQGVSNTEFSPKGTYTVEQAITTILRLYKID